MYHGISQSWGIPKPVVSHIIHDQSLGGPLGVPYFMSNCLILALMGRGDEIQFVDERAPGMVMRGLPMSLGWKLEGHKRDAIVEFEGLFHAFPIFATQTVQTL